MTRRPAADRGRPGIPGTCRRRALLIPPPPPRRRGALRAALPLLAALALAAALPATASAQRAIRIPDEVTCASCAIHLDSLFTAGGLDSDLNGLLRSVVPAPAGGWIAVQFQGHGLLRFGASGEALEPWGREGQGPGEYRIPSLLTRRGDTVIVHDMASARITYLDPHGEVVKLRAFPAAHDAVLLDDGSFVVNSLVHRDGSRGRPLHTYSPARELQRSFGGEGALQHDNPGLWLRALAPARDGNVWVAHRHRYSIEKWSPAGELLLTIERDAEWFPPGDRRTWGGPGRPISPLILDLAENAEGRLLVLINVAAEAWDERVPGAEDTRLGSLPPVAAGAGLLETVVEVLDPATGTVIARERIPRELTLLADDATVVEYAPTSDGIPFVTFWRLRLELGGSPA